MKNISRSDDLRETLMLPINEARILSNFLGNYLTSVTLNPRNAQITLWYKGKRVLLELTPQKEEGSGYLSFKFRGRLIRLFYGSKKELVDTVLMVKSEFLGAESAWLDVKGRDVVDIGAYVGDTAIVFALNGARHVYALEPYPYFYEIGKKNMVANMMQGKITMINAGVAGERKRVEVASKSRSFSGKGFSGVGEKKSVDMLSLDDLVRRYKLKDAALKVDCEGYEYDILLKAEDSTLRKFADMEIEYHYGYLNIEKRLIDAGFKVERHKPMKRFNFGTRSVMVNGFMHARRIGR